MATTTTTADHRARGAVAEAHGGADTHAAAHGHGAHLDTTGDKGAAFMGLFAGAALLGGLIYGMVTWTNSHYAHEGGEKPAAAAAH